MYPDACPHPHVRVHVSTTCQLKVDSCLNTTDNKRLDTEMCGNGVCVDGYGTHTCNCNPGWSKNDMGECRCSTLLHSPNRMNPTLCKFFQINGSNLYRQYISI